MTTPAAHVGDFAVLLVPAEGNVEAPTGRIARTRAADLALPHAFATGLERDRAAVENALTLPYHNGRAESANNNIKRFRRETYGPAGHALLRQRVLLS